VSGSDLEFEDTVFASGEMEVIFNLGEVGMFNNGWLISQIDYRRYAFRLSGK